MEKNYLISLFSSSSSSPMFLLSLLFFLCMSTVEGQLKTLAIYFFGDSHIDQGNNNYINSTYKGNFLPYGKDFMGGNDPTGRFSNGKTIADFMAKGFGVKEFVPPYLDPTLSHSDLFTGVSFGSASTGYDLVTAATYGALSMPKQLELFEEYIAKLKDIIGEDDYKFLLSNSIYIIICGTNDITNYFTGERRCQYTVASYIDYLLGLTSKFVQNLNKLGARRILIFEVPPVGCVPYQRTLKGGFFRNCSKEENEAAKLYNSKLPSALTTLNHDLSDSNDFVAVLNYYNPLYNLIQNPAENGFKVADKGCCGTGLVESSFSCNPSTPTCKDDKAYIFWDSYHYTEHANRFLVVQQLPLIFRRTMPSFERISFT